MSKEIRQIAYLRNVSSGEMQITCKGDVGIEGILNFIKDMKEIDEQLKKKSAQLKFLASLDLPI